MASTLTLPIIESIGVLKMLATIIAGGIIGIVDSTAAFNMAIKVIGNIGPLIERIYMIKAREFALSIAIDDKVFEPIDQDSVMGILIIFRNFSNFNKKNESGKALKKIYDDTISFAIQLETTSKKAGLPEM